MKIYSKLEIQNILKQGNSLSDKEGSLVLDKFQENQPDIYHAIFGIFCQEISEINEDMGNLFIDLCFDIMWFYRSEVGDLPKIDTKTSNEYLKGIDMEIKSTSDEFPMDQDFRNFLKTRFIKTAQEDDFQMELLYYLNEAIVKYVSFNRDRKCAESFTRNMIFIIIRYMDKLSNMDRSRIK